MPENTWVDIPLGDTYPQAARLSMLALAASGMCAGGRVVNYLKAFTSDPTTDIVFVGYQAAGTPGRVIQRYGPRRGYVELDGQRYPIRAGRQAARETV